VTPERASDRFFTASNMISLLRLVMTVPVVITLQADQYLVAFVLCWIAAATDWLDGFVARRTGTVSEWGKVVDPLADKVLVGAVVVMLLVKGLIPLWFVGAVIARDILILAGAVWARRRIDVVLPSLWSGKFAVSAIALTGVMAMLTRGPWLDGLMYLSCGLMALSLWDYSKRLHGLLR